MCPVLPWGAITLSVFQAKIGEIDKDRKIIFYRNRKAEHSAARLAGQYNEMGYQNAKAMKDGFEGWNKAV